MRGHVENQGDLFAYFDLESLVPKDHPMRPIKANVDTVLAKLSREFDELYSSTGRPSIPPERLLKASLLMAFYSVRSERVFCEMLRYNFLFRWFLDMKVDERSLDQSNFSRLRTRMLATDISARFFQGVVALARKHDLMSSEHMTVDGTLLEAWASHKSFVPKDGSGKGPGKGGDVDFKGQKRKNDTHQSKTDPQARLLRKGPGKEAKLCHGGHALMENRNGMLVDILVTDGLVTETQAATQMLIDLAARGVKPKTLGADKGYYVRGFVKFLRDHGIKPHIAQIAGRSMPGLDGRTTRHESYKISQVIRKRVEEIFGWTKIFGGLAKSRFVGTEKNQIAAHIVGAAYNLIRMSRLVPAT